MLMCELSVHAFPVLFLVRTVVHLRSCVWEYAQDDFMGGAEIRVSDPVVSFRETIGSKADHVCMSKSPNKHNRCGCSANCGRWGSGPSTLNSHAIAVGAPLVDVPAM